MNMATYLFNLGYPLLPFIPQPTIPHSHQIREHEAYTCLYDDWPMPVHRIHNYLEHQDMYQIPFVRKAVGVAEEIIHPSYTYLIEDKRQGHIAHQRGDIVVELPRETQPTHRARQDHAYDANGQKVFPPGYLQLGRTLGIPFGQLHTQVELPQVLQEEAVPDPFLSVSGQSYNRGPQQTDNEGNYPPVLTFINLNISGQAR